MPGSATARPPQLLVGQASGATAYSVPIQTLLFFTALTFLPAVVLMMTGFTRIVIVLSLLRQALGTQAAPPNQVIIGLSLFLTFFVMSPTLDKVYQDAWLPYSTQKIEFPEAVERAGAPMRAFMLKQTRHSDMALFAKLSTEYYRAIPTSSGRKAPPPLNSLAVVGEKEHQLEFWLRMGFGASAMESAPECPPMATD